MVFLQQAAEAAPALAPGGAVAWVWLAVALPLVGFLVNGVLSLRRPQAKTAVSLVGTGVVIAAFVVAGAIYLQLRAHPPETPLIVHLWRWIPSAGLDVSFAFQVDQLSVVMLLIVTGVGSLIHLFSVGYMHEDPGYARFFSYLNLFVVFMLVLVLGASLPVTFVGWEGVGLCSYLLIGFWFSEQANADAGKKAFLVNRIGDLGVLIAMFLIFWNLRSLDYVAIAERAPLRLVAGGSIVTAMALLLFLGCAGKSAQIPLYVWLPDAMAGPTPVSALIHAATMVTAGVYLIARCSPLYNLTEDGRLAVAAVGAVTLLIGSVIGCAYDDFKKVLAYSTVSQIGYMFLAVGLGPAGYALGIAHLLTHGFFKAGLFLGAGSVMHAMNDEGDIRRLGGLWRHLPVTFATFTLGYLALIGFPFLSGYYSKDAIIESAFTREGWQGWVFGGAAVIGAGLTAFYMTRLMLLVFFGEERWRRLASSPAGEGVDSADGSAYHPHESPAVMVLPMVLLAAGSVGAGYFFQYQDRLSAWLAPSVGELQESEHGVLSHSTVAALTLGLIALGVLLAWLFVGRRPTPVLRPIRVALPVRAARADLYANSIAEAIFERPGIWLTRLAVFLDNKGVDGVVNGTAALLGGTSGRLRRLQTGFVRSYALGMLGSGVLVIAALLVVRYS